ncbi:hypothetical protein GSI_09885 [Ganoderma sinense ZZ0214-1]|uniref:Uncharacterized protein n=1 Tax=Ganoderma sinense ZZ0214-1 TaxID=1077348 RepID=A0A2G8S2R3_9APHY|nr:hypothetical protein GSI_09885 [Ganoderma sinense ZZ0214-1]
MSEPTWLGIPAGHNYWVEALVVSPDSKWVASGSRDWTIILWDAGSGAMAQQWVAHSCKSVRTLAFSPDSRFLLSGGEDHMIRPDHKLAISKRLGGLKTNSKLGSYPSY